MYIQRYIYYKKFAYAARKNTYSSALFIVRELGNREKTMGNIIVYKINWTQKM